jgi:hypothetical protein
MSFLKDFVVDVAHSVWTRRFCTSEAPREDPADPTFLASLPILYADIPSSAAAHAALSAKSNRDNYNGVNCARVVGPTEIPPAPAGHLRFVCASDTHLMHRALPVPPGDVFLHAGDILVASRHLSRAACIAKYSEFNAWLGTLPHPYKFVIAGNHDWCLDETLPDALTVAEVRALLSNASYLLNEDAYVPLPPVAGQHGADRHLRIFGSPFSIGSSGNRAFQGRGPAAPAPTKATKNAEYEAAAETERALIAQLRAPGRQPIDVLLTHHSVHARQLPRHPITQAVIGPRPVARVHVGGHYHEFYGARAHENQTDVAAPPVVAVCASVLNGKYKLTRGAVVFDLGAQ